MFLFSKALIIAPHTDDGELGCGATIAKLIESNVDVYYLAFSAAEESVPQGLPKDTLRKEVKKATEILGIKDENVLIYHYQVRKLSYYRQDILEDLIRVRNTINPDVVFIPTLDDLHQDHSTVAQEGLRAFKKVTLLGYELPWNNISFETNLFIKLEERHLNKKIKALKCYESQKHRDYLNEDYLRSLAKVRGVQIGVDFAETFEVIRWVINDKD
ncbi:MAG: PIG-L family deacetylase [Cyanobacteriota bacterium]